MLENVLLVCLVTSIAVNGLLLFLCWQWYRLTGKITAERNETFDAYERSLYKRGLI